MVEREKLRERRKGRERDRDREREREREIWTTQSPPTWGNEACWQCRSEKEKVVHLMEWLVHLLASLMHETICQ